MYGIGAKTLFPLSLSLRESPAAGPAAGAIGHLSGLWLEKERKVGCVAGYIFPFFLPSSAWDDCRSFRDISLPPDRATATTAASDGFCCH